MSQAPFIEWQSADPVEQAIARQVMTILNDTTLDRTERERRVRKAQRELVRHRQQRQVKAALQEQVTQARLPKGHQACCVTVQNGIVHVGAVDRRHRFTWIEAGTAPQGVAANQASFVIGRSDTATGQGKGKGKGKGQGIQRVRKDPIAERRQAMTGAVTSPMTSPMTGARAVGQTPT